MSSSIVVGDITITPLLDGTLDLDARGAAIGVPLEVVAAANPGLIDAEGAMHLPVICHLVHAQGRLILVDTGIGPRRRDGWPAGVLDVRLRELGIEPSDIDVVTGTHLHADHVGWNTIGAPGSPGSPAFPNARYVYQRTEWDHWLSADRPRPLEAYLEECVVALVGNADIDLVEGEVALTPELSFVATPGHTPGHVAIGISSHGERALIVGDATHYRAQLQHPDWSPAFDLDPLLAVDTRRRLFDMLEGDPRSTLVTSHWPFPGAGRIVRVKGRRLFRGIR